MTAITALLLGTLAASPVTREEVSMNCLHAVNRALHHIDTQPQASGTAETSSAGNDDRHSGAVGDRYERAACQPSRVVPGRVYVRLTLKDSAFYRDHRYYVVEPFGDVTVKRSMPCEENPSVCE